jgi:Cof subfamily protein (haloacid dehalogenase superfamily)
MYRTLLALDLDGTLLDDEGRLGLESKHALKAAQGAGALVAFVTGRRDVDMLPLGADTSRADYLILNNGGKIVETSTGRALRNLVVQARDARSLVTFCLAGDYVLHVVKGLFWAVNRITHGILDYAGRIGIEPLLYRGFEDLPPIGIEGFMATGDAEPIARFIDRELPALGYTESEPGCIDIMRRGVSKWEGISALVGLLGLVDPEVITAGNYSNDIDMIERATIGIAVGSALDEVKAAADYVTSRTNAEDPAVEIVDKFILRRKAIRGREREHGR